MNAKIFLKHLKLSSFILYFLLNLSGCFMMFFPVIPMMNNTTDANVDSEAESILDELIQDSVNDLVENRGSYEQILLGESKVVGNFICSEKFRLSILAALRKSNERQFLAHDGRAPINAVDIESSKSEVGRDIAVLNTQIYQSGGKIWLAQQLVDLRSNQIFWSGINSRLMSKPAHNLENNDPSSTIGSRTYENWG
jgi:hypothetical protein